MEIKLVKLAETWDKIVKSIETFLSVETKDGQVIPFFLNNIQALFIRKVIALLNSTSRPLRLIILKGRQFGFSTLILAILFIKCLLVDNTRAAVISHDKDSTKRLFRRVRFFAAMLRIKPELSKESETQYSFPSTNSMFYVGTAGAKNFGRGDNLTDVHCSEVAFWKNAAETMNGLIQAVGKTGSIIIETTANGIGGYFANLWKRSWKNETSSWTGMFFKWTRFVEYEMDPEPGFQRTEEEEQICAKHKEMNDRKLAWRRWKISETEDEAGFTPVQIFHREYPLTPKEAFISSGQCAFSLKALDKQIPKAPILEEGGWKFWKKPSGYSIMAIDSAEGLDNSDRTVIDIYDENLEQVAQWAGWCDTDEAAEMAIKQGNIYKSFIINEVNNMGIAVNNILKKKYPLKMQYHREVFDEIRKTKVRRVGFRMTGSTGGTRKKVIAELATAIRTVEIKFNSEDSIDEATTFVKKNGKYQADEGCNDDRVVTAGLAIQGYYDHLPKRKHTQEENEKINLEEANKRWRAKKRKKILKRLKYKS